MEKIEIAKGYTKIYLFIIYQKSLQFSKKDLRKKLKHNTKKCLATRKKNLDKNEKKSAGNDQNKKSRRKKKQPRLLQHDKEDQRNKNNILTLTSHGDRIWQIHECKS